MYAIPAWYGFQNKSNNIANKVFLSTHSSTVMSNLLSVLNNYRKITMIICFIKQLMGTMPCIIFSQVLSPMVIIYELQAMVCV